MECRAGCGACCIAPSINKPLPGMPNGKPAGLMCVNLDPDSYRCRLWGTENYPELCRQFKATAEICGQDREEALLILMELESATAAD